MAKVTYEFDLIEDSVALKGFQNIDKLYCALDTIYTLVRNELKHGQSEKSDHVLNLLQQIKVESGIIHELE